MDVLEGRTEIHLFRSVIHIYLGTQFIYLGTRNGGMVNCKHVWRDFDKDQMTREKENIWNSFSPPNCWARRQYVIRDLSANASNFSSPAGWSQITASIQKVNLPCQVQTWFC